MAATQRNGEISGTPTVPLPAMPNDGAATLVPGNTTLTIYVPQGSNWNARFGSGTGQVKFNTFAGTVSGALTPRGTNVGTYNSAASRYEISITGLTNGTLYYVDFEVA